MPSLYVHIPFCQKKCLFCSFTVVVGQGHRVPDYLKSLESEARRYSGSKVSTVYVGGGTPTFLSETQLEDLFGVLRRHFLIGSEAEFTLEANPEGLTSGKARLLKAHGVNRVSLGVQSLNDRFLKFLGRAHDRAQALAAFEVLRQAGFSNLNVDLMYGFPQQTDEELQKDLRAFGEFNSEHVSAYSLTIEENSRFHAQGIPLNPSEAQGRQYRLVAQTLGAQGFRQYEVSNFAKPGYESRHNLAYWTSGGGYIGLGLGAHSYLSGERSWNVSRLPKYLGLSEQESAVEGRERLNPEGRLLEMFLVGLRMVDGVDIPRLENDFDCPLSSRTRKQIEEYVAAGLFVQEGSRLRATPTGLSLLDEIAARLI